MKTNSREIRQKIAAEPEANKKTIRSLEHQAYLAWVEEGGREEAAQQAIAARKAMKDKYKTSNGLTVHKLRQAGVEVKVTHIRYTEMSNGLLVPVPSYLRKQFDFHPRGGATHVTLKSPDGSWLGVSSVCNQSDSFDYKLGIKIALDCITNDEAQELLAGLAALSEIPASEESVCV